MDSFLTIFIAVALGVFVGINFKKISQILIITLLLGLLIFFIVLIITDENIRNQYFYPITFCIGLGIYGWNLIQEVEEKGLNKFLRENIQETKKSFYEGIQYINKNLFFKISLFIPLIIIIFTILCFVISLILAIPSLF